MLAEDARLSVDFTTIVRDAGSMVNPALGTMMKRG